MRQISVTIRNVKIQDAPFGESFGRPDVMWLIVVFHVTFAKSPTKHDDLVTYDVRTFRVIRYMARQLKAKQA